MKGDPCKHCGKPISTKYGNICDRCHNYPENRKDHAIELYNQFVGLKPKEKGKA